MAFQRRVTTATAGVGRITVSFASMDAAAPLQGSVGFDYLDATGQVIDSVGSINILPQMTAAQVNAIKNFLDAIRAKVIAEAV